MGGKQKIGIKATSGKLTIVFYHGNSNSGKTTVLNKLIDLLEGDGTCSLHRKISPFSQDRRSVILLDNVLVGVGTQGDSDGDIVRNIDFFKDQNVSIAIVASRSIGAVVKANCIKKKRWQNAFANVNIVDIPVPVGSADSMCVKLLIGKITSLMGWIKFLASPQKRQCVFTVR